jgi:plasmid stabilization system protein ParE
MKITFLKVAEKELDHAFEYYETIQNNLGFSFISEIEQAQKRITQFPQSYTKIGKYSRRCLVQKFPYGIIYQHLEESNEVLIVAIAHLHQEPYYWVSRE